MGTGDRTGDRQAVFEALTSALQQLHGGVHARDVATALFRHATGSTALVGLTEGGDRAVFYAADAHTLTSVPLDAHGLDLPRAERLRDRSNDPTAWVVARGDGIDWVHPRYRWVLDGEAGTWTARP